LGQSVAPSLLDARVSAFVLRLALGGMAEMLLTGQRAFSAAAEKFGYRFRYRDLEPALEACKPLWDLVTEIARARICR
jgi:NAD dependent epimerase/dehydratase family enzyme